VDDGSGMSPTAKPVQIQALITKLAVEALDVRILRGLARLDEVEGDAVGIRPDIQDSPSELRAVVDRVLLGRAMGGGELVEHTRDSWARSRGVDLQRQTLPRRQIEDVPGSGTVDHQ